MKLVKLGNLPNNMRVNLEETFRKILFGKAIEKLNKGTILAKELGCHTDTILNLRKGKSFIKIAQLKKLSEITSIHLKEIEANIIELRSRDRNKKIQIKLPISATPELASVIGHCVGDGSLSVKQFSFFNQKRELIDEVKRNVQLAFSTNIEPIEFRKSGGWEIEFPTNIARLVAICGGPVGQKIFLPFGVPAWIMNGSTEIKANFLRALFDDEGWVKLRVNRKTKTVRRMIGINMSKSSEFGESHKAFFEEIRKLLSDLGVDSSKVIKMGKTKNGNNLGIIISNFENLSKFFVNVGFTHLDKNQKLLNNLTNSKRFNFQPEIIPKSFN